jgi:hypothetical protein
MWNAIGSTRFTSLYKGFIKFFSSQGNTLCGELFLQIRLQRGIYVRLPVLVSSYPNEKREMAFLYGRGF